MSLRNSRFAVRSCSTNSTLRAAARVSAKRMRTSPASNRSLVGYGLARAVEFLFSYFGAARAPAKEFERNLRADAETVVISVDFLESAHGKRRIRAESRLRDCAFRGVDRLTFRGERRDCSRERVRPTRIRSIRSVDRGKRFVGGEFVVCARSGTEHARSASSAISNRGNRIVFCMNATSHYC